MVIAIIVICAVLALLALTTVFAAILHNLMFGKRSDKNPKLKYFTAKDFGLSVEPAEFKIGKNTVRGGIYRGKIQNSDNKTVVFCHGMGPGHIAYTTEIATLCNAGFTVLAFDNIGCNLSDGKNIRGMYSGVQTAVNAVEYAKNNGFGEGKIYLCGHSWGGYSALCASKLTKVDGVVAISAPTSTTAMLGDISFGKMSVISSIFRPFLAVALFFRFGKNGNMNASKAAEKCACPVMLIHGDCDMTVNKGAAFNRAKKGNITRYLANGKAHNPYNTPQAEKLLSELQISLASGASDEYFKSFDFKAATEEDSEVMGAIVDFLKCN